jgi:hypothetical protein
LRAFNTRGILLGVGAAALSYGASQRRKWGNGESGNGQPKLNDLEHKDWLKLFDSTFSKYGIGNTKYKSKSADMLQLPTAQVQMMVGEMWENYLIWGAETPD